MEFLKNLISSLSYGRYRLVPNRGTFWENFPLLRTFSCFHCFHFHYVLFFAISFQTPLKNPSRRAGGTKASGFLPPALRAGFLRGVIICKIKKKELLIIPGNIRDYVVYCPAAALANIYHGWDRFYVPF